MTDILELLNLTPSEESIDYVNNKGQFHLYNLITEQRHKKTWNLSFMAEKNVSSALEAIFSVDDDLSKRISRLKGEREVLESMVDAIVSAVEGGHKIYVYGCGATGRLAKQMESTFWKPFWRDVVETKDISLPADIEDLLIGEMTGADRALVSSLEGFEDLLLKGELQLRFHGIERGDVVVCVTEGGETSSVIGTILSARAQYGEGEAREAASKLFFVYNNPDEVLLPFHRSKRVIDEEGITKLNLATGPQAVAGSTRMQATTIETFVVGAVLEEACYRVLKSRLTGEELARLGFIGDPGIMGRLGRFDSMRKSAMASLGELAKFTALEAGSYRNGRFATYLALKAMITMFIDCTERSPTFRLYPLDRVDEPERLCWVQVWTEGGGAGDAWQTILGRPFRGLDPAFYEKPLREGVDDPYLKKAALTSLENGGPDQGELYDFSFSKANVEKRGPRKGDLGVLVLIDDEIPKAMEEGSLFNRFISLCKERNARWVALVVTHNEEWVEAFKGSFQGLTVPIVMEGFEDPLGLCRQMALKIALNAHSTTVMALMDRLLGNTMTNVSPSNLKLIGRATFLIQSHVNDALKGSGLVKRHGLVSFEQANAVLLDAMKWVEGRELGQTAEVALSIIRILESLKTGQGLTWERAEEILEKEGLVAFVATRNPALRQG